MTAFIFIWIAALDIACIWAAAQAARGKHRDPLAWGALAFCFGFFALAMIAVVPALDAAADVARDRAASRYPSGPRSRDGAVL